MATYTNKSKSNSTYVNKYGVQDPWTYNDPGITYNESGVAYNFYQNPSEYTNKRYSNSVVTVRGMPMMTLALTYPDSSTVSTTAYTNTSKQSTLYVHNEFSQTDTVVSVGVPQGLLLGLTYAEEISTSGTVYTNKPRNN